MEEQKENELQGFDDKNIEEEQAIMIAKGKNKDYDAEIEDSFEEYLQRIKKKNWINNTNTTL